MDIVEDENNQGVEDTRQFLFECPRYATHRQLSLLKFCKDKTKSSRKSTGIISQRAPISLMIIETSCCQNKIYKSYTT